MIIVDTGIRMQYATGIFEEGTFSRNLLRNGLSIAHVMPFITVIAFALRTIYKRLRRWRRVLAMRQLTAAIVLDKRPHFVSPPIAYENTQTAVQVHIERAEVPSHTINLTAPSQTHPSSTLT